MIGVLDIEIQAANPQLPLPPIRAYKNSPTSVRLRNVPKAIGNWKITSVQIVAIYPDNSIRVGNCVLVGGVWVGTIEGSKKSGRSENGFTVFASGTDEHDNSVNNYVLGKGLIEIMNEDGSIDPEDTSSFYVRLYDTPPSEMYDGFMYPSTSGYVIWQNGEGHAIDAGAMAFAQDAYDLASSAMSLASEANAVATSAATMAEGIASCVPSEATSSNQLADKSWVSANVSSLESSIVGGSVVANKATNALGLVDNLATQPSTRVIIDEHGNAVVQKYVQSGWYVDHVEVRIGAGEYTTTTDYWCTVDAKTTDDGLEFTLKAQDYARTLPVKTSSLTSTDQTITEISHVIYLNQSETGVITYLKIYCSYSSSPMWVNVSRLVPDEGTQCGLKASQITNDGTFVTQQQVEPSPTFSKWARGAEGAIWLLGNRGSAADKTKQVFIEPQSGKLNIVNTYYPSWYLTKYNGTTLDTPIELKWGYYESTSFMLNRRQQTITINSWAWVATTLYPNTGSTKNRFYIKANADENGTITSLDDKFYVNTTAHDITYAADELSIATFDESSDSLECSRTGKVRVVDRKYFVLEDDLSSYATQAWTTTQLSAKQDALTQPQLSAVDSGITASKVAFYDSSLSGLESLINSI